MSLGIGNGAVRMLGNFITEAVVSTGTSIAAAAQTAVGGNLDMSSADTVVFAIDSTDSNTYSVELSWLTSTGGNMFQDNAATLLASGLRRRGNTGRVNVIAPKAQLYVTNSTTGDRIYAANVCRLGVKAQ